MKGTAAVADKTFENLNGKTVLDATTQNSAPDNGVLQFFYDQNSLGKNFKRY